MGHGVIMYGFIESVTLNPNFYKLHELNCKIIEELPEDDEWPFLVKSMFNSPKVKYRQPIITFGVNLKDLNPEDDDWKDWIFKFENLLSKLYWYRVVIHIETENFGDFTCNWTISDYSRQILDENNPIKSWNYSIKKMIC